MNAQWLVAEPADWTASRLIQFDEHIGDGAQAGEVGWSAVSSNTGVVLTENDIQHPMQGICDSPMSPHSTS